MQQDCAVTTANLQSSDCGEYNIAKKCYLCTKYYFRGIVMKIALAQLNYTVGDFDSNRNKIIDAVAKAKQQSADLVVFAEQAIDGTPSYSLLDKVTFLEHCEETLSEIASHCDSIAALVGLPVQQQDGTTASAVALIQNGKIVKYATKASIKNVDDRQYISSGKGCVFVTVASTKVAVVVGEDIDVEHEYGRYADVIINPVASAYARGIIEKRYNEYIDLAYRTCKPIVFVNHVGAQTDVVFDGSSAVFNSAGEMIKRLKSFEEDFAVVDLAAENKPVSVPAQNKTANVYNAMLLGLRDYFAKNGFFKACVGLSGGIDSAVVGALAVDALGAENVYFLMMPSQFSSDGSVDDAIDMAKRLGVDYNVIPIQEPYKALTEALLPVCGGTPFGVTEENIQARIRGAMLMAMANKFKYTILNTTNKSEFATGYGTLYGDYIGDFSILADLYKCEVFSLARYINRQTEKIPENILQKEPSAELHPGQKDSDYLPPYEITDAILYRMIEEGQHREEIINAGFDADVVLHIHARFVKAAAKRCQFCPTLRLSTRQLIKGVKIPVTSKYGLYY